MTGPDYAVVRQRFTQFQLTVPEFPVSGPR